MHQKNRNIGIIRYASKIFEKIGIRLRHYYRKMFCQKNYIFRYEGTCDPDKREDCVIKSYTSFDQIPEEVKDDIQSDGVNNRLEVDKLELNDNATLWIVFVNNKVASTVFTRKGEYFKRWFLDLQKEDVIVFRLRTHPHFRGQGLAPSLIRYAISSTLEKPGYAYIDCRTYNTSSIHAIEKVGFIRVAVKKTIKRRWALYD